MSRWLHQLGRAAVRRRRLVVLLWLAAAVSVGVLARTSGGEFNDDFRIPGAESQEAYDLLVERFPEVSGAQARVVFHAEDGALADPQHAGAIDEALDRVAGLPHVTEVVDPLTAGAVSPDGTIAIANVQYDLDVTELGAEAFDELQVAVDPARSDLLQVELGGDLPRYADEPDTEGAEMIGVLAAVVILLLAFGSFVAMGLPIGLALFGLATGISGVTILASVFDISTSAPTVASMIGIGVGIDYALFIVTRHKRHLEEGMTVEEAAGRANATSGQAVIFAGGTVVIAISGLALVGIPSVASMGFAAALIVALMVVASITLLPALLGFAGLRLLKTSLPWRRRAAGIEAERRDRVARWGAQPPLNRWGRWGRRVADTPWRYLLGGLAVLLLLAAPMLSMRLGQADEGSSPTSSTIRRAYDLTAEGFGPGFNGPLLVSVDLAAAEPGALDALTAALDADDGVALTLPPELNEAGDAAIVVVVPKSAPQDAATSELVHRMRDDIVPTSLEGTGADASVGGLTAVFIDLSDRVAGNLPLFIAAIVGMSFVLLMIVFRSILVPLKAALMNLLSIGAAYGVVVAVFQWGWGRQLVGLEHTVPIVSFIPMFMFAILFGLSMDYEVFLLSRVREEYLSGKGNTESVVEGISSTARVITSAALIMIAVFFGFVLGDDPIVKMMGLGLATAVLVDATIVRVILVPASMKLLGDANWWLPGWLDRILPRLDIEGEAGLPEPEYRVAHPVFGNPDEPKIEEPEKVLVDA